MAKSRLSTSRNNNKPISEQKSEDNVISLDLEFEVKPVGSAYATKYNLLEWCHELCDPQNPLAKPSRISRIQKLREWVEKEKKDQTSQASIFLKLTYLKQYIYFCDVSKVNPFTQAGYLSYAGNSGELRRLVDIGNSPKKYQFEYYDGEEFGLKEVTASRKKYALDKILSTIGFDVSEWQATIQEFSTSVIDSSTQPYSSNEWQTLVKRTQLFFDSLLTKLIEFKKENQEALLPGEIEGVVVDRKDGRDIKISVGKSQKQHGAGSPFNQCMSAAYTLFAYYTAFNDSVIREVRHPIKIITSKVEGRTSETAQVRAYKGRSSKDVSALFSSLDEKFHEEATEDKAGFIVAEINKRDTVGFVDGIDFLKKLELLSKAYSDDPFDTLIYFLDSEGKKTAITFTHGLVALSKNINLLTDSRNELTDYLIKCYTDLIKNGKITSCKRIELENGSFVMSKKVIHANSKMKTVRLFSIAYAALSCMANVSFRNALMPLTYSEKDKNGAITVSFKYEDGSEGQFVVVAKYKPFLKMVESYAATKNPVPSGKDSSSATRSAFLLPLGKRPKTEQWTEGEVPIGQFVLQNMGIGYGDYFLNITSGRIRVTHSDLEYDPKDNGKTAQNILQHSADTADKRYRNGHPVSNNKQLSQGMQTITHIAHGKTRKEAKELVKKELNIPVLEYDIWKKRNQVTNPNGIACDGKMDITQEKDWHYAARKFAKTNGIIKDGQDITCYQYDLCVFCTSAKLVDDPYAIYKLLSFLDVLGEVIDLYPERASVIQLKIERFQMHIDDLPLETIELAERLLEEKGRYPIFNSITSVAAYL